MFTIGRIAAKRQTCIIHCLFTQVQITIVGIFSRTTKVFFGKTQIKWNLL